VSGNVFGSLASNSNDQWFRSLMNGVTDSYMICADSYIISGPFLLAQWFRVTECDFRFRESIPCRSYMSVRGSK
jgi:hypothetical protein